ncbi:MAG: sigma-70 family RNA polymerase sigma factor [Bryobacteraceae bacterium]|nr:sigma-70 family RNA polymerase sigma factor [Bryobacteraceae bacterium]
MLLPLLFAVLDAGDDQAALIDRLKRRDPDALDELYKRYGKLVFSLIVRVVRDSGVAEDLTQETFLRVWNRVQAFDGERGKLGPWLLAIARNRSIDYLRSVDGRMSQSSLELSASEQPGLFVSMDEEVLNSDRGRKLKAAFEHLSQNQRQVIELAYFEGLSQSEMATKLNQPLGTVKTWTRAALKVLRDSIGPESAL